MGEIARTIAKQHLWQAGILKHKGLSSQRVRAGGAHPIHRTPVPIGEKSAAVEHTIRVGDGCKLTSRVHGLQFLDHALRIGLVPVAQGREMTPAARTVQPNARSDLGGHHARWRQHRAAVGVYRLQARALLPLGQGLAARKQRLLQRRHRLLAQHRRVVIKVDTDHFVAIFRVCCQRHNQRRVEALGAEHAGNVHDGFQCTQLQLPLHPALVATLQHPGIQLGLLFTHQPRHRQGRLNVGQGIVGGAVCNAIGCRQLLQLETDMTVLSPGPLNAFRAQRPGRAQQIDNVPA